mmetsp:Transcript_32101/g.74687  ORF Transcript_32101/g.74687 Transcript_32101/m.74687 type:complete len:92 (-) Transcript_32101:527-802(-)
MIEGGPPSSFLSQLGTIGTVLLSVSPSSFSTTHEHRGASPPGDNIFGIGSSAPAAGVSFTVAAAVACWLSISEPYLVMLQFEILQNVIYIL